MKIVLTFTGPKEVEIVPNIETFLTTQNITIIKVEKCVDGDCGNTLVIADLSRSRMNLKGLQQVLGEKGELLGFTFRAYREELYKSMHRIQPNGLGLGTI